MELEPGTSLEVRQPSELHRHTLGAGGGSRQIHRAINGADMKRDPDNGYAVLSKTTSVTDFVLFYVKVTQKRLPAQRGAICLSFYVPGDISWSSGAEDSHHMGALF